MFFPSLCLTMFALYGILLMLRVFCFMCRRNTIIHICLLEICWEKNEPEKAQNMDSSLPRTSKMGRLSLWKSQSVYSKRYAPNTVFKKNLNVCIRNMFIIHEGSHVLTGDGKHHAERRAKVPFPHWWFPSKWGQPSGLEQSHGQQRRCQICAILWLQHWGMLWLPQSISDP